ncbi:hypothetical protein WN944_026048 [Citrus x changshan-huyou]|uniref:Ubiquitin-like domain-containing protein n=1 Tax=Citrus x changshan-huyou TaxID=2935761 RepID=A0AAP0QE69_9ROSI
MKTVTLNVEKSETIKNLKGMVHEKEGTSEDIQDLFFAGDRLMNGRLIDYEDMALASPNVKRESTMQLLFCAIKVLSISVKAPSDDILKLKVKGFFTVADVKAIVGSITGVSVSDLIMNYAGKLLEDCKTLAFYDIKEE